MHETNKQLDLTGLTQSAGSNFPGCRLVDARHFDKPGVSECLKDQVQNPVQPIGLILAPGQLHTETDMTMAADSNVMLIMWQVWHDRDDILKKSMWRANRAGLWNHLIIPPAGQKVPNGLLFCALKNPNIVNSWSFSEKRITASPDGLQNNVVAMPPYANVTPLPGRPLWETLSDPIRLLQFLYTFGVDTVQRWRVMDDNGKVERLGRSIRYTYAKPGDLPPGHLDEICRMVEAGGSVDMDKVTYNLERAFLIAYATEFDVIIGNSSLKHPRKAYIESLNRETGLDFGGYLERGYTSVRPEYRGLGIGTKLLEGLTKRTGGKKLYAIITEDNLATQKIAIRNKTRKLTTFFSRKTGKNVGVWVPE